MIPISQPDIGEREKQAVLEVLESGHLAQGPRVQQLEDAFAAVCRAQHAVAIANGTAALQLALLAHGIGPGDEVITTPFTFIASVNSILFCGARPVLADIQADTFNLDPERVEEQITPRTRAILPVHLYGNPCDMDALAAIAARHNLVVIQDAAQAIGASYKGRPIGSEGTACFSLYATKNVMCGEGGMITTDKEEIAARCRLLRNHGSQRRYYHEMLGYNLRLSDLHAAIGLAQLERLSEFTARRRANAEYFNGHLEDVITPQAPAENQHSWHQYTIRINGRRDRDAAAQQLREAGIGTGIFYPVPAHRQAHIVALGLGDVRLPVAEKMAQQVLSLPVHPRVTDADREMIVDAVNRLL